MFVCLFHFLHPTAVAYGINTGWILMFKVSKNPIDLSNMTGYLKVEPLLITPKLITLTNFGFMEAILDICDLRVGPAISYSYRLKFMLFHIHLRLSSF